MGKIIYHANTSQKKAGIATITSHRADFKVRKVIRNKEEHCIMIKESVLQEDIRVLNMMLLTA